MSKGLEALERNKYEIESTDDCLLIKKELKALEIIVKKANIRLWENHGNYFITTTNNVYGISKEKYDLLKEVLKSIWLIKGGLNYDNSHNSKDKSS